MEPGKEIVEAGKRGAGPDRRDHPIRLNQNEASGFLDPQALAQLGIGIPKGRKVCSGFCHELMNLVRRACKKKKPGGLCLGLFHGDGEIFCKLEAAVAVMGEENKHHRFFFGE